MSFELGSRDGGGDVKLRLAERSGEVHVTLHSNDPALNHQLREGIHDLASVLSNAGYDADAWTGQGREQARQQREQNQHQLNIPKPVHEGFNSMLNEIPQEVI
jgi:hypothetical protein